MFDGLWFLRNLKVVTLAMEADPVKRFKDFKIAQFKLYNNYDKQRHY